MVKCYFCDPVQNSKSLIFEDSYSLVFRDNFPVTRFHTLITPREHIANIFDLSTETYKHLFALAKVESEKLLEIDKKITGFNIGVNQGVSAGQTIMHAHIHIIPRRDGDVTDAKGGVRWVVPDKADYWSNR
jgi:ATP adenylyltransferase